jgi:hypothetical protein
MTKRQDVSPEALDASLLPKQRKPIPHAFVLDAISTLSPYTRPMFGCVAIYVKDKIVLILRDKPKSTADNGVWLATTQEHHQSLRREFPNMRSIQVLGKRVKKVARSIWPMLLFNRRPTEMVRKRGRQPQRL